MESDFATKFKKFCVQKHGVKKFRFKFPGVCLTSPYFYNIAKTQSPENPPLDCVFAQSNNLKCKALKLASIRVNWDALGATKSLSAMIKIQKL